MFCLSEVFIGYAWKCTSPTNISYFLKIVEILKREEEILNTFLDQRYRIKLQT